MNPVARRLRDRNTPYGWVSLAETAAVEIDRLEFECARLREVRCGHWQMAMGDLIGVCEFCEVLQAEIAQLRSERGEYFRRLSEAGLVPLSEMNG